MDPRTVIQFWKLSRMYSGCQIGHDAAIYSAATVRLMGFA